MRADFLPDKHPEFGQCVHKIVQHPARPDRLFLQNHWGLYRSDDWGDTWHDVTAWCGPERLAPRWWQQEPAGPRDYFTARERTGTLWLLFRCARRRAWFAEGWWD